MDHQQKRKADELRRMNHSRWGMEKVSSLFAMRTRNLNRRGHPGFRQRIYLETPGSGNKFGRMLSELMQNMQRVVQISFIIFANGGDGSLSLNLSRVFFSIS